AAVERQAFDKFAINHRANRCVLRIDDQSARFYRDNLRGGTHSHLKIDSSRILYVKDEIRLYNRFEAGFLHFDAIAARRQARHVIASNGVSRRLVPNIRVHIDHYNFRANDHSFTRIGDISSHRCIRRLRAHPQSTQCKNENHKNKQSAHRKSFPPQTSQNGFRGHSSNTEGLSNLYQDVLTDDWLLCAVKRRGMVCPWVCCSLRWLRP